MSGFWEHYEFYGNDYVMFQILDECLGFELIMILIALSSLCFRMRLKAWVHYDPTSTKVIIFQDALLGMSTLWSNSTEDIMFQGASPGFVYLEELNVARSAVSHLSKFRYVDDNVLHR